MQKLHNTWLKLEDAVEKLKVNRRRLRLDETGGLVVGLENRNGQRPKPLTDLIKFGDCWEWQLVLNRKGYGMVSVHAKDIPVHRLVYMLLIGPIPAGMLICHSCDNRCCVHPHHLFVGTDLDNCHDKISKGRLNPERGEDRYCAKLTENNVRQMRKLYTGKHGQQTELARQFGVGRTTARHAIFRERWRHVI